MAVLAMFINEYGGSDLTRSFPKCALVVEVVRIWIRVEVGGHMYL